MTATSALPAFEDRLAQENLVLRRVRSSVLQLNVGKLCNLVCKHCHVNAGPGRKELMSRGTIDRVLNWLDLADSISVIDLTGGAPEMNPEFRYLVSAIRERRPQTSIIDRCNLTILLEPGFEDLGAFLARNGIEIVASMPCYEPDNVDRQRGDGVFIDSIRALQKLNRLGYGLREELPLNLVYNPAGASLPPDQIELECEFKESLNDRFGIVFNRLYTITNMPIARFLSQLRREGESETYHQLLVENFNAHSVPGLMCRDTISVDWRGYIYDCDFNQMLGLPLSGGRPRFLWEIDPDDLIAEPIAVGNHCFGCTAGAGSSCRGALSL